MRAASPSSSVDGGSDALREQPHSAAAAVGVSSCIVSAHARMFACVHTWCACVSVHVCACQYPPCCLMMSKTMCSKHLSVWVESSLATLSICQLVYPAHNIASSQKKSDEPVKEETILSPTLWITVQQNKRGQFCERQSKAGLKGKA